ncbi:hypothetical protein A3L12_00535 [Thermococcus sp. P6]|uniref:hypothetical protein n=1 Tax=Thermococcus sp. P6 TaxID=122420 RepID=UPI000B59983C|nr:hypothetical protein [Thermococcus sp. P6]ASJ09892.1 hypothetical protein A3L12_00535 [Thermococcus sp. P6]
MDPGDILVPKERTDAVVMVGVDRDERVEFIKVYAVSEERARETLRDFFNAGGLFPSDYLIVSSGIEEVGDRKAITTAGEAELSSFLGRLGLKLLSNGVLYLEGVDRLYQFTLVSEDLYKKLSRKPGGEERKGDFNALDVLSLGVDVIVENLRGIELEEVVPEGSILLREPDPGELWRILREERDSPVVVETKNAETYSSLDFPAIVRLPPLTVEEFVAELSERLGFHVEPDHFAGYPPERLNLRNVKALADLVKALMDRRGLSPDEALRLAVRLNLGEL